MKLATFTPMASSVQSIGVTVEQDRSILDLSAAYARHHKVVHPALNSMLSLIESGDVGLDLVRRLVASHDERDISPVCDINLMAPLPTPPQIRDALCFREHLEQATDGANRMFGIVQRSSAQQTRIALFGARPFWYKCNRFAVAGPDATIVWPSYSQHMDYELELAVIIGRQARDLSPETASHHIFGYTIFNDFSARDVQGDEMAFLGPAKCKDFDDANVFGPFLVTADAFDPSNARMSAKVNGETWSDGNASTMYFKFPELLSWISRGETLHPGEIIGSGTVGGGCGLEIGRKLSSGDVVELTIEGIGTLRNKVVSRCRTNTSR